MAEQTDRVWVFALSCPLSGRCGDVVTVNRQYVRAKCSFVNWRIIILIILIDAGL